MLCFTTGFSAFGQSCPPNIDYEFGNFSNWQVYAGDVASNNGNNIISVALTAPINGRHNIITAATSPALDFYGKFPKLCPNGSGYSIRLGDSLVGRKAERVSYTFKVPVLQNDFSIIYQYAVVFEDPDHLSHQQPRFTSRVFDVAANQYISCASFEYVATSNLPGFQLVILPNGDVIRYKSWTPVSINLKGYAGKQIRLEFTTADCTLGAHFGYAYIDVGCSSIISGNEYCSGSPSITLTGPVGYQNYFWYANNLTQLLGSTQSITLTPPPPGNTKIALDIVPFAGFGCRDTIFTVVKENQLPEANAGPDKIACKGTPVTIGMGAQPSISYLWAPGNQSNPTLSISPGGLTDYILTATSDSSGCFKKDTVRVSPILVDTTLMVTGSASFCTNSTPNVLMQLLSNHKSIQWYKDGIPISGATAPTFNALVNGAYHAVLQDSVCLDSTRKVNVVGYQPPSLNYNINANNQCVRNNFFQFTNTTTSIDTALTFSWQFGDGSFANTKSTNHTYAASGLYNVKLITTNLFGCKDTLNKPVNVYPNPVSAFTVAAPILCANNSSVTYSNTSSVSQGTMTYQWTFGDGGTSSLTTPSHAYLSDGTFTTKLIATTNNGCTDTSAKIVTINPKPTVSFGIGTPNQCFTNNSFSFTNSSSVTLGTFNSAWTFGDGGTSTMAAPVHSYTASGTYSVKLIVTTNNGCKDSIAQNIIVYPKPTAAFAASTQIQCSKNNSFTFTNSSSIIGSTLNYNWSFGDGGTSTALSPAHTFTNSGTYVVKLVVTSSNGCKDSTSKSITVNASPTVSFGIGAPNQCLKDNSFSFTNSSSVTSGILSYNWSFGDGGFSTVASPTHSFASTGTYIVKLVGTSSNGCKDSTTFTVNVNPTPLAAYNINLPNQCLKNNNFVFTNNSSISTGTIAYNWNFGNGITSNLQNLNYTYPVSGVYNVRLIATSNNGCIDSTKKTVTVIPNAISSFGLPGNSQCFKNNSFNFVNNSVPLVGGAFTWLFGDGSSSSSVNPIHSFTDTGTYTIKLVVKVSTGCNDSTTQVVSVLPSPKADFTIANPSQCLTNNNFSFTSNSSSEGGTLSHLWLFGDGGGSNLANANHTYNATGAFPVLLTVSAQGCKDTVTKWVRVSNMPTGVLNYSNGNICAGDTAVLTATGGAQYAWYKDGTLIPGVTGPIYKVAEGGVYTVDIINAEGCVNKAIRNVLIKVEQKPKADFSFDAYCANRNTNFTNTSLTNNAFVNYLWQFPDSSTASTFNANYIFRKAGDYNVRLIVSSFACKQLRDTIVKTIPVVSGVKGVRYNNVNAVIAIPQPLKAREIGTAYKWAPNIFLNNTNIFNPLFNGTAAQQYTISITQLSGCVVVDTQLVTVYTNFDIFVPQAFSPNNDGNNDWFFPFLVGDGELVKFKVINRWGIVVFETTTDRPGWDGNYKGAPQPLDGYVWEAEAKPKNGSAIRKKGTVTLVR